MAYRLSRPPRSLMKYSRPSTHCARRNNRAASSDSTRTLGGPVRLPETESTTAAAELVDWRRSTASPRGGLAKSESLRARAPLIKQRLRCHRVGNLGYVM